ncbi:MAG: hypothetical protein UFA98_04310 [Ruminococcus sp.]|nr:hypothetical protein [Ruminococcus sp.]
MLNQFSRTQLVFGEEAMQRLAGQGSMYDKQDLCGVRGARGDRLRGSHINIHRRYNETESQAD